MIVARQCGRCHHVVWMLSWLHELVFRWYQRYLKPLCGVYVMLYLPRIKVSYTFQKRFVTRPPQKKKNK